jgi:hypothetical protein
MREISNLFIRSNTLIRRYSKCSIEVKIVLFKSFCLFLYGSALWLKYSARMLNTFKSCYHRCVKIFFGFPRLASVTNMLIDLTLPNFDSLMNKCNFCFKRQRLSCNNEFVAHLVRLGY